VIEKFEFVVKNQFFLKNLFRIIFWGALFQHSDLAAHLGIAKLKLATSVKKGRTIYTSPPPFPSLPDCTS